MDSNKSKFENVKSLFDELLDALNESNSEQLRQIEELRQNITELNETVDSYRKNIESLESRISYFEINEAMRERDKIVEQGIDVDDSVKEETEDDDEPFFIIGGDDDIEKETITQESGVDIKPHNQTNDLWSSSANSQPVKEKEDFLVMDTIKPEWYDWEVDYPAPYIQDIAAGIGFNDRLLFLKVLFNGDEKEFINTVNEINKMESFKNAINYIRQHFPNWDEQSDEVYRFYMNVRRKLRK
ncbi:MAG: hypothetical protein RR312_05785 [Bacteroidales bacterium]